MIAKEQGEIKEEYEEYCEELSDEVNGKKIEPISFETFKEHKENGVFEEMNKGLKTFNESMEE